jgi:2-(1,2-epoxy-1,2-dihydrophenyl)acetyl-CoA isomerase
MAYQRVKLDFDDGVAILRFNHPEVMNAIGAQMLSDLGEAVDEIKAAGTRARCLLLTGEGRGFCAGANLSDGRSADTGERRSSGDVLRKGYHPLLMELRGLEMPMVSAVNGAAAGVGMSFAIAADIVCAGKSAFFLQAFAKIGLVPDGGATWLLPRLIGWGRAAELSLLAERLPAEKAKEWGLVNFVFEDAELVNKSLEIARRLANGPRSLALIRKLYWASPSNSYEQQLDLEAQMQSVAGRSKDNREGVAAFLSKRDPKFTGE